ncbi:MAG TPA: M3 family metallopeptidase [Pyrinomonadaceae bacterium]|nr:M3 family metallopeptidase [Pyrinomonadaceae bacterium]
MLIGKFELSRVRRGVAALLLGGMLSSLIVGQGSAPDTFVAIPPAAASRYHIDFARHFFASPEAEKADRAHLYATLKELEALKGKVDASAANLELALQLSDRANVQLRKHDSYLYLRNAVNTADPTSLAENSALYAEFSTRTAFLREELMQLDDSQLAAFVAQKPSLKSHLFAIESVRRYRPYTLSLKEEQLLSATAPDNDWPADLYAKLRALPQVNQFQRDLFAFTLTRLASTRTRSAELHHFPDAASEVYLNSYWTKAEVDDLMEQIAQHAELYKRYERIRIDYRKKTTEAKGSDQAVSQPPRYTIDQASEIIRRALAPLGPDYGRELEALLDPANGRMDIVPGEHRKRGGFSQGFIGTDSVFYSVGFAGSYNDLRVLTHESTHAVHRQLMNHNQVLPPYAEGPHYLFEAFAIFNELLLPDYLYRHETDPLRRQFYLERFLEGKGLEMFRVAPEVVFEHAVYEGVKSGAIKGADDLDTLSQRTYARYWLSETGDSLKTNWMTISLMYEDPFYDVNYVYGALLALNFYEMYLRDPKRFVPRYITLMKNGFDAPPAVLLKRFLDLDLHDPRLIANALKVVEDNVNLLEKSYQK